MTRLVTSCLLLLLVPACKQTPPHDRPAATENGNIQAEMAGDMTAIRLKAAEERIVQLEKQVGVLENTPEKLDLQLLTQRVEQLEARVYAKGGATDAPAPAERREESKPSPQPTPTAKFNPFGL